ncbi:MAG: single-stranded DNA-binding protein [Deltaproteobacteria bacterium]|jgi:single-strand DNA-binding protein|nr:single-stranded DNA-binding protein [Deltaproteobacteria bacterium]
MSLQNFTQIIGNLGRPPEYRTSRAGDEYAVLSVGTSTGYGERKKTQWIRVMVFDKQVAFTRELAKGDRVLARGEMTGEAYVSKATGEAACSLTLVAEPFGFMSLAPRRDGGPRREPARGRDSRGGDGRQPWDDYPADPDDALPGDSPF